MATYVVDPTLLPAPPPTPTVSPMVMPQAKPMTISLPNLAMPFAKFDTSSKLSTATSILNWASLLTCFVFLFLWGQKGLTSVTSIMALVVCTVFTLVSSVLMSTSAYSSPAIGKVVERAKMANMVKMVNSM